jgi:hypothetical protein
MQVGQVVVVERHLLVHHFSQVVLELLVKVMLEALVLVEVATHTAVQVVVLALLEVTLNQQINRVLVVVLVV